MHPLHRLIGHFGSIRCRGVRVVSGVTGVPNRFRVILVASDVQDTMRKIVLFIAATVLILGSVEVWAGGSWTAATDDAGVFLISNAL